MLELKSNLEPYATTAIATCIAVQWDDAVTRVIAEDENRESFAFVNAVGTTIYAAVLYLLLMYVHERFNKRLLNLIKQSLMILVGWMWKSFITALDQDINDIGLTELSPRDRLWARFGIAIAFAVIFAPFWVGLCTAILHTTKGSPKDSFSKHFSLLLLGASALVIGYAWHLALEHFSTAVVYNDIDALPSVRLIAAIVRSLIMTLIVGGVKAYTSLVDAAKVDKPPKATDTLFTSFLDRSRVVGNKSLSFIVAFTWYDIIDQLAFAVTDEADGWGPYIVQTVFVFFFLAFAVLLAYRGATMPICCGPIKPLGNAELLYFSTVAIQLGWAIKNSYQELIDQTITADNVPEVVSVIYWSIGATLLFIMWIVIFFMAVFGNVRRSPQEEARRSQM